MYTIVASHKFTTLTMFASTAEELEQRVNGLVALGYSCVVDWKPAERRVFDVTPAQWQPRQSKDEFNGFRPFGTN